MKTQELRRSQEQLRDFNWKEVQKFDEALVAKGFSNLSNIEWATLMMYLNWRRGSRHDK